MATSGTDTFLVTRDDIINSALRLIKAQGERDLCVGARLQNCVQSLNMMCKSWVMEGLPLWAVLQLPIPMVAAQSTYPIGPASLQQRPLRILNAFIRNNATQQDTSLMVESRYNYEDLGAKFTQSRPNQIYYDPQLTNGLMIVWPLPSDATETIYVTIQRQFQDFNLSLDNPDFPQEAYKALKWGLASELYAELGDLKDKDLFSLVVTQAKLSREDLSAFWQEYASINFTPSERSL